MWEEDNCLSLGLCH